MGLSDQKKAELVYIYLRKSTFNRYNYKTLQCQLKPL